MSDPIEAKALNYEEVEDFLRHNIKTKNLIFGRTVGFRDLLLKPEICHAFIDNSFEHPSEIQCKCIPYALLGSDLICEGYPGMGKTSAYIISILQLIEPKEGEISCLVLSHERELAYQINDQCNRLSKYLKDVSTAVLFDGLTKQTQVELLKEKKPNILIASPSCCLDFISGNQPILDLSNVKYFVIDEVDRVLKPGSEMLEENSSATAW